MALSPHLDDAVFSVGAFLRREAARGTAVTVLTVFANDPDADAPAGSWDALCGFQTAASAARTRRDEDRRACAIVGAQPQWLPYADETYGTRAADDEIWECVRGAVAGCDVLLVPGFPLRHHDHAWLARLVAERRGDLSGDIRLYGEQPYASAAALRGTPALPAAFERVSSGPLDRLAKFRAMLQYRSQLRPLGPGRLGRAFLAEQLRGGELLAPSGAAADDPAQRA